MTQEKALYFAYGSNLNDNDLQQWCDTKKLKIELTKKGNAKLNGYGLDFTRKSKNRNCGVADIVKSTNSSVFGVLFETDNKSLENIDKKEGVASKSYKRIDVEVIFDDGSCFHNVITYEVVKKSKKIIYPNSEYLNLIIEGAEKNGLPDEWIEKLKRIPTKD